MEVHPPAIVIVFGCKARTVAKYAFLILEDDRVFQLDFFPDLFVALFVAFCHVSAIGELFAPFLAGNMFYFSSPGPRKSEHVSFQPQQRYALQVGSVGSIKLMKSMMKKQQNTAP